MHPIDDMKNAPVTIEVQGHVIEIRELTMASLPAFSRIIEPFMAAFDEVSEQKGDALNRNTKLFNLLMQHGELFCVAAEAVTNANADFYRKLPPDDFFKVAALIVERNAAFFIQRLAPSLLQFAANLSMIGTMLSVSLQPQDSTSPTS